MTLGLGVALRGVGGMDALFVPYLRHTFLAPPEAMGLVMTAQGVGILAGGLAVSRLGDRASPLMVAVFSIGILALGVGWLGAAPGYSWALLAGMVVGLSLPPVSAGLETLLQQGVPAGMLGRAGSVVDTMLTLSQLTSLAGAGWVAGAIGLRPTFVAGAVLVAGGALALGWRVRSGAAPSDQEAASRRMGPAESQ